MQQYPMSQRGNNNNNKMMIAVLVVLCILAVVALIGLVWVVAKGGDDDKNNDKRDETEYVTVYHPETGEKVEIEEDELEEYLEEGYTKKKPSKKEEESGKFDDAVVLYRPDGTTLEVPKDEVQKYLDREGEDKYYEEEVMYIYHVKEERKVVKTSEAEEYLKEAVTAEDGTTEEIPKEERWYNHPVVIMYAAPDRSIVISDEQKYIDEFKASGWFEYPVSAVAKDGEETKTIPKTELEKYLADGWKEINPKAEPCKYCGTQEHTSEQHPTCRHCGSPDHTSDEHAGCDICGSNYHTTGAHPCTNCGGRGHDASRCTVKKCTICGAQGHTAAGHICEKCGTAGHGSATCSYKFCSICGATGHDAYGHVCARCGGTGHDAAACTAVVCGICGARDHDSNGHPKCAYCGSIEHLYHPQCPSCGSYEHTVHPMCDYCDGNHTTAFHPTCSWCGRKDHSGAEHDAVIAAEAAAKQG